MCGSIKYEHIDDNIGHIITATINSSVLVVKEDGTSETIRWLGHIREESGLPKLPYEKVKIVASEYTEKGVAFQVDKNKAISGYVIYSDNFPSKKGLFIITRYANPEELKKCRHPRHPKIV